MGYSTTAIDPQRALAIIKAQKMQPVEWAHSVSGSTPPRLAAIAKNVQHADQTDHEPAKIILYLGPDENEFARSWKPTTPAKLPRYTLSRNRRRLTTRMIWTAWIRCLPLC